jgi:hypothetical protein
MQSAIIAKLKRELAEPISTERQVVYVLVEIRKLLEVTGSQAKYDALWFHASWAVHPTMNKGVAAKLLEYFDAAYPLLKDKELYELPSDLNHAITDAIALRHFQRQLKDFLVQHDLSTSIVERQWTAFLRLYASVIEDCPLIVSSKKLKNLSHVVVNVEDAPDKLRGLEHMEYRFYRVRWICHATDKKSGELFTMFTIP